MSFARSDAVRRAVIVGRTGDNHLVLGWRRRGRGGDLVHAILDHHRQPDCASLRSALTGQSGLSIIVTMCPNDDFLSLSYCGVTPSF